MVTSTVQQFRAAACAKRPQTRDARPAEHPVAFTCPKCKQQYGDPLYHGPIGHAPAELCFDCWASEWGSMMQVISRGGNWEQLDVALFLLCQGFSHQEAANLIGVRRRTVYNWIRQLRQHPEQTPQWLIDRARQQANARR